MKARRLIFLLVSAIGFSLSDAQDTKENADFKLAVNLYNDKLYDLAVEQFRQFVATYSNTQQGIEARFYLGLSQSKLGQHDDARLTFQNFALAFPEHPKAPEAWWNVAEAYVALNNPREAALAFERVKTFHSRSKLAPDALARSAEYFEVTRDRESAKKVLRTLIQDYPSADAVPSARLKLARMYLADNQSELARAEAKRVIDGAQIPEIKAEAYVAMAEALVKLGKYEEAQSALREVIVGYKATPSYHTALLHLGFLQRDMGSAGDAMDSWKAIDKDSAAALPVTRQQALVNLGDAYLLRKDYSRALESYRRGAATKGSQRGIAAYRAGVCAMKSGAFTDAAAFLKQALADTSLAAVRSDVLYRTAQAHEAARNYTEASKLYQTYREESPDDPRAAQALLEVAKIYQDFLKDQRQALSLFESVVRDFPNSAVVDDALFGSAEALRQSGSLEQAVRAYETLVQRFPSSELVPRAQSAVERIQLFDLKDKESGLEKLALLVGDVIAQESRGDLAFRLAEIYFHDLKDYDRAATQYGVALQAQLAQNRQAAALFYQARAYQYLAMQQASERAGALGTTLAKAIAGYQSVVERFPTSQFTDDAMISALQLKLQQAGTISEARTTGAEFLKAYPTAKRKDLLLFELAEAYRRLKAFADAAMTYERALQSGPSAEVAADQFFRLGESLLAVGARDTSAIVLEDYLGKYPNDEWSGRAAWMLAQHHASKGNALQAVRLYQMIGQAYYYTEFNRDLELAIGDAKYQAGDFAGAIQAYQARLRTTGDEVVAQVEIPARVFFNLAASYERTGSRVDGRRYYGEFLRRDDSSELAGQSYYALATIAREENNVALATRYLQEAGRLAGTSARGYNRAAFEAADLFFRSEDYASALTSYTGLAREVKSDTLQQHLLSRIAVCYFRLNNTREADARAGAFVRRFPGLARYAAEFEYERGLYYLRREDPTNAKRYFDNVIQKYSSTPFVSQAVLGNARVAELMENPQQAIRLYESILQRYPNDQVVPKARLSLGNLYYNQEKWDSSARQYKAIVDNESRAPELLKYAMNNLILAYKQLSLFDAALELTRKYIERFPDDPDVMNKRIDIGVLYQRLGYDDQSILHLRTLLESADADIEAEVRYYIGEGYFHKGAYQQAILEFLKVPYLVTKRTKNDWVATSYYMAGQSYEKMSKFDQAITMYKQIIDRSGIDATFKTGAQREIDRVTALMKAGK